MCTKIFFSIHYVKIWIVFFFLSRGYNLFTAYLKDLISKIRIQMEKNMRMKFLKQRITVILLFVASVCICGNMNSISSKMIIILNICWILLQESSFWQELPIYAILKRRQIRKMNWCWMNTNWCMKRSLPHRNILFLIQKLGTH